MTLSIDWQKTSGSSANQKVGIAATSLVLTETTYLSAVTETSVSMTGAPQTATESTTPTEITSTLPTISKTGFYTQTSTKSIRGPYTVVDTHTITSSPSVTNSPSVLFSDPASNSTALPTANFEGGGSPSTWNQLSSSGRTGIIFGSVILGFAILVGVLMLLYKKCRRFRFKGAEPGSTPRRKRAEGPSGHPGHERTGRMAKDLELGVRQTGPRRSRRRSQQFTRMESIKEEVAEAQEQNLSSEHTGRASKPMTPKGSAPKLVVTPPSPTISIVVVQDARDEGQHDGEYARSNRDSQHSSTSYAGSEYTQSDDPEQEYHQFVRDIHYSPGNRPALVYEDETPTADAATEQHDLQASETADHAQGNNEFDEQNQSTFGSLDSSTTSSDSFHTGRATHPSDSSTNGSQVDDGHLFSIPNQSFTSVPASEHENDRTGQDQEERDPLLHGGIIRYPEGVPLRALSATPREGDVYVVGS
ncbi:hypothetical protein FN846DRAFT_887781 [Sphaerosporella brunnea]|uniref:Uncharacterized protein n=1 Tax=Sphaerosporella brunnea TaxID=1250544 RepID=A0A5J5F500_9PEZI|nr:hypothetical protein FN846DRAFT_887781 [Sphaerosporella brunnea]